jgi:ABC-type dipeptide/oligopeptide/nickel transport system permease component
VLGRHALRNALLPVITIIGLQLGALVAGQVVIEQIFAIPGVGRLFIDAIQARDVVLIQGLVLMIAAGLLLINLCTDVIYGIAEPRMRAH